MPHFKQRGNDVVVFDDNDNEIIVFSSDGKVYFGDLQDVTLYRSAANALKTDDDFKAASITTQGGTAQEISLWSDGIIYFHNTGDTSLYRSAAGMLKTDTGLTVGTQLKLGVYTTAGRPSATGLAGTLIYVSDASAGQKLQYSDGSSWVAAG